MALRLTFIVALVLWLVVNLFCILLGFDWMDWFPGVFVMLFVVLTDGALYLVLLAVSV